MLKIPPNSFLAYMLQVMLAVGYVGLVKQLLPIQSSLLNGANSWLLHIANVLLVSLVGLLLLYLVNFALLRRAFLRLGMFSSLAVFIYFYVYTLQGHFAQYFIGLFHSPQYLINMLLFVSSPFLVGKLLQSRFNAGTNA